eukprot:scaffold29791_cov70-Cyclotella_meneghiniana.AAC.7
MKQKNESNYLRLNSSIVKPERGGEPEARMTNCVRGGANFSKIKGSNVMREASVASSEGT